MLLDLNIFSEEEEEMVESYVSRFSLDYILLLACNSILHYN